ncbi:MAG: immunoglobulin domain-containing protein [Blastocatellia bacterium]
MVTGVTAAQNGTQYQAVFSNHCGSATSNPATLTVNVPASVTMSPINQTICSGGNATFTAAGSGFPTPTVQWQVSANGGPFANIPGATSPTLTINSVTPAQNGTMHQAVFTNSCTMATTSPATLTVNVAPAVTANHRPGYLRWQLGVVYRRGKRYASPNGAMAGLHRRRTVQQHPGGNRHNAHP